MRTQRNGGPAFPVPGLQHDEDFNGMTLRDYFAAKAMASLLVTDWPMSDLGFILVDGKSIMENNAICAYKIADAMLSART